MKLKEAFPKPGQVPLGGVEEPDVLVPGYGKIKPEQLKNMVNTHSHEFLESLKNNPKKVKYHWGILEMFVPAYIEYLNKQGK
ncbi:MAG: hypothetical protein Q8Q92_03480 [bacterium]|nr:hypothetical protein [bacterium]